MSSNYTTIQSSLPSAGVPATGQFTPTPNVQPNTFDASAGLTPDPPYNTVCIGDASTNIVGTSTTPYLPMALPAYIPTLYENMYRVQTSLKNVIPTVDVSNNREYPTIYAVKQYVASQLSGSEILVPDPAPEPELYISTGVTTTFLTASIIPTSYNVTVHTDSPTTGVTTFITTYPMNMIDNARNGAEKVIINTSALGSTDGGINYRLLQIVLQEPNQFFVVNGQTYKCYAFTTLGDSLNAYQYINQTTGVEFFFVLSYGGIFSNTPYYS